MKRRSSCLPVGFPALESCGIVSLAVFRPSVISAATCLKRRSASREDASASPKLCRSCSCAGPSVVCIYISNCLPFLRDCFELVMLVFNLFVFRSGGVIFFLQGVFFFRCFI